MNLVHKHDGPFTEATVVLGLLHDLPDFLDAAGDSGKVDKRCLGAVCDDACQRGFANTGRSPEDHGADAVAFDQPAQHLAFSQQMGLSDKLG